MAAATSFPFSMSMTIKLKRRKLEENTRAIQHHWLPEDLIKNILVRLPAKSIVRFKSVCKLWYSLTHSRYFTDFHRNHCLLHTNNNRNRLFYSWLGEGSFHVYTIDFDLSSSPSLSRSPTPLFDVGAVLKALKAPGRREILDRFRQAGFYFNWERECFTHAMEPNVVVVGPLSNGIFAVFAEVWVMAMRRKAYGYYSAAFCNPATGEYDLLESPPVLRNTYDERSAKLFCKQYYGVACIYKAGSNTTVLDYKMIMITRMRCWSRAFMFSQRRGRWKLYPTSDIFPGFRCDSTPIITQDFDFLPQALVNGYWHWMTDHSVLRFDIANEVFDLIPAPPSEYPNPTARDDYWIRRGVFAANDHLAAIVMLHQPLAHTVNHTIDVWMMTDYGVEKSWTKIHSSKFQFAGELKKSLGMLFSRDNHGGLERMFFQDKGGMVLSYDFSSCNLKEQAASNSFMPDWTNMEKDGYNGCNGAWACWKPIGLSYVETLEPLFLEPCGQG